MAAAGSAVGLGNIWGFPTQAASNGGAAFLLVYLFLAFTLAYPALMAELIIGRHAHANAVIVFMLALMGLTVSIISGGVQEGIERWSSHHTGHCLTQNTQICTAL